ncbi:NUDIX hydrolase [Loktanella agnita]|uniref:NUDIX hydrolase n=1 Tax=Loktanella agnita TaxID=287097 RepID=UPI00398694F7
MRTTGQHDGAKVALFLGDCLISILRDDRPDIPYPNLWDLPGGGREGDETPFETMARELNEELGLHLPQEAVLWQNPFPGYSDPQKWVGFFVARLPVAASNDIVFGDEGQRWDLFALNDFMALPNRMPSYGGRLDRWVAETGGITW